jgi:hypothetical protein
MSNQIFKEIPKKELLFNLLDSVCEKNENYYIFNNNSYKLINYKNLMNNFLKCLKYYYHDSKQFYINRNMTFTNFNTILRHLCKCNNIIFFNSLKYINGSYEITYKIYFE